MKFCYVIPTDKFNVAFKDMLLRDRRLFYIFNDSDQRTTIVLHDIRKHGFYIERAYAEKTESYKQIIPGFVIRDGTNFLIYQRQAKHSEQRLAGKWTCVFGGHIDPNDSIGNININLESTPVVLTQHIGNALYREMMEETGIDLNDVCSIDIMGYIYDHRDAVGRVHFGILFEIVVPITQELSNQINSKDEVSQVKIVTIEEAKQLVLDNKLEGWGEIAFNSYKR